jgi:hypothetical protein
VLSQVLYLHPLHKSAVNGSTEGVFVNIM